MSVFKRIKNLFVKEEIVEENIQPKTVIKKKEYRPLHPSLTTTGKLFDNYTIKELNLLSWIGKRKKISDIPVSFHYSGVNVNESIDIFIKNNLIQQSSLGTRLSALKVIDLKELLEQKGLKKSGVKKELVKRLLPELTENDIEELPTNLYELSDKGKEILDRNQNYMNAYNDPYFDLEYYIVKRKELPPSFSYADIRWAYLNEESMKESMKGNFGKVSSISNRQYSLLIEEKKYKDALKFAIYIYLIQYSGLYNDMDMFYKSFGDDYTKVLKPDIYPGSFDRVVDLSDLLTKEDFIQSFNSAVQIFNSQKYHGHLNKEKINNIKNKMIKHFK